MQCDVCGGVIYISNKSKYLKTEMRYAIAVKTNLYNFKSSLKNKSFLQTYFFISYTFNQPYIGKGLLIASLRASQSGRGRVILVSLFSPCIPEIPLDPPTNLYIYRFVKPKLVVLDRHRSRYLRSLLMLSVKRSSQNAIFDLGETHFLTRAWTFCS